MSTPDPEQRDEPAQTSGDATAPNAAGAESASAGAATPAEVSSPVQPEGERPSRSIVDVLPSPVFVLLVGLTALAGWLSWTRGEEDWFTGSQVYAPFVFILGGWIVSIAVHEFAHAALAYALGERSLRGSARLRLNPFAYRDGFAGWVLPLVYLFFGGFGLTGPAVHPERPAVTGRVRRSVIALGGIAANLLIAVVLAVVVKALIPEGSVTNNWMIVGLIYLCFLNVTSALVNVLPIPGLDGFDAIAPYLPGRLGRRSLTTAVFGSVVVFAILWFPQVNTVFLNAVHALLGLVGMNEEYFAFGDLLFRFWVS
ncbi:site-2 protease family protein [Marinactinospora thermotolerans]|uniref:site-2 protease family protein n=1 Tax=Marinactinospora thermotolerans TaxID=531310 RepID=UPI003D8CD38E